jgi:hypothetical protein
MGYSSTHSFGPFTTYISGRPGTMSALQTFMLVVDHDKDEAKRIAESVAQGTTQFTPRTLSPSPRSNRGIMQMSKARRQR